MKAHHASSTAVLAMLALSAGCISLPDRLTEDDPVNAARVQPGPDDPSSALVATVTDPSLAAIEDAELTVETRRGTTTAATDATGKARLDGLEPGRTIVTVRAPDHRGRQVTVDLPAEETVHRAIVLRPAPGNGSFVQRYEFHGFFECSASYLIVTGDCLATARAISDEAGGPSFNATNERNTFPFPVHDGWTQLNITQTWEDPTVATGSMMRLNLEPRDPNRTEGHAPQYADVDGASPIELSIEPGQLHENATNEDMIVPEEGGWLRTRTFHLGLAETHNPAGTEYLGTGVALQQSFTVVIEVRYG